MASFALLRCGWRCERRIPGAAKPERRKGPRLLPVARASLVGGHAASQTPGEEKSEHLCRRAQRGNPSRRFNFTPEVALFYGRAPTPPGFPPTMSTVVERIWVSA